MNTSYSEMFLSQGFCQLVSDLRCPDEITVQNQPGAAQGKNNLSQFHNQQAFEVLFQLHMIRKNQPSWKRFTTDHKNHKICCKDLDLK